MLRGEPPSPLNPPSGCAFHGRCPYAIERCRIEVPALESFDGRFYTLRVTARDDVQEIGRGTVGRAVVRVGKFVERMKNGKR